MLKVSLAGRYLGEAVGWPMLRLASASDFLEKSEVSSSAGDNNERRLDLVSFSGGESQTVGKSRGREELSSRSFQSVWLSFLLRALNVC